jgi:hypothetical protein
MVSVLASSAVDREFETRSGQTKDNKIGICCFSAKHAALRRTVLLVEETGVPGENDQPVAGHCRTLSHNVYRVHLA